MIQSGYGNRLGQIRYEIRGALKRYKDEKWPEYEIEHELEERDIPEEEAITIARALIDKHWHNVENEGSFRLDLKTEPDWYVESKPWKFEPDEDDE